MQETTHAHVEAGRVSTNMRLLFINKETRVHTYHQHISSDIWSVDNAMGKYLQRYANM